jgi:plastocyanin
MRCLMWVALSGAAVALSACGGGGGGGGGGGTPSCTPSAAASMTLTAGGVSPADVCVLPGGRVTFTNRDSTAHDIEFGTAGCATVGIVASGGEVTATFPTQDNCAFHDAMNPNDTAFQGTVAVTAAAVQGGVY